MYQIGQLIQIKPSIAQMQEGYYSGRTGKLLRGYSKHEIYLDSDKQALAGKLMPITDIMYRNGIQYICTKVVLANSPYPYTFWFMLGWVTPSIIIKEL